MPSLRFMLLAVGLASLGVAMATDDGQYVSQRSSSSTDSNTTNMAPDGIVTKGVDSSSDSPIYQVVPASKSEFLRLQNRVDDLSNTVMNIYQAMLSMQNMMEALTINNNVTSIGGTGIGGDGGNGIGGAGGTGASANGGKGGTSTGAGSANGGAGGTASGTGGDGGSGTGGGGGSGSGGGAASIAG